MVRSKVSVALVGLATMVSLALGQVPAAAFVGDQEVSVGSADGIFSQNKQNEPAVAIDANHPTVLAAGSNDNIDMEACNVGDDTTCPFTPGVGASGIYFSFDSGDTWTQPTYSGFSARGCLGVPGDTGAPGDTCTPSSTGPIGTLPGYFENDLASGGDPAVAFGPVPDSSGNFDWDNGSRLYYANLAASFPGTAAFKGFEAVAVSRIDGPVSTGLTSTIVADQSNWMAPVIVTKQSSTTFSDKEQVWADNASSSPFFGNAYVCLASFRSNSQGNALPTPLVVSTSTDGGDTWAVKQVTDATNNPFNVNKGFGRSGCTIRTDSAGVVYVFANQFAVGTPGDGAHILIKSFDGGKSWTKARTIFRATDTCFFVDPVIGRCMMDGVAGARDDLSSSPSVDIANGAPTGIGATNVIHDTWVDGRNGSAGPPVINTTQVRLAYSADGGTSWTQIVVTTAAGAHPYYAAVALSPDGTDAYLVFNAFTTPFQTTTATPRGLVGAVLHADVNSTTGAPGAWFPLNGGLVGDPRASSQNNLVAEFLGDYVYAAATNSYGAAVWNDVRFGADCPAMDAWRQSLRGGPSAPKPAPQQDCPPGVGTPPTTFFGNTDIFGGTYADPS